MSVEASKRDRIAVLRVQELELHDVLALAMAQVTSMIAQREAECMARVPLQAKLDASTAASTLNKWRPEL